MSGEDTREALVVSHLAELRDIEAKQRRGAPKAADKTKAVADAIEGLLAPKPTKWQADVDPLLPPLAQVAEALRQKAEQEQWARWLKEGETPLERVEREHRDNQTLLRELAKAKNEIQLLREAASRLVAPVGEDTREALDLARRFHEIYERLAPDYGYQTRPETRQFNVESANGRLMVAVCRELLREAASRLAAPVGHVPLGCEANDCPTPDLCRGIGCQASYIRKAAEAEAAAGDPDITVGAPTPPAEAREERYGVPHITATMRLMDDVCDLVPDITVASGWRIAVVAIRERILALRAQVQTLTEERDNAIRREEAAQGVVRHFDELFGTNTIAMYEQAKEILKLNRHAMQLWDRLRAYENHEAVTSPDAVK